MELTIRIRSQVGRMSWALADIRICVDHAADQRPRSRVPSEAKNCNVGDESYGLDEEEETEEEEDEEQGSGSRATKFTNGSRAFKMAFTKIMKKSPQDDLVLGPVLSAHKKLVVKKLAEDVEELKAKGDAKKAKNLAGEKGHAKPAGFLDSKEKFLISVATKGVVKLFNAVNKAQNPQRALNPSRSKDAKGIGIFSEIRKTTTGSNDSRSSFYPGRVTKEADSSNEEPGWAPLRDSYMLTSSKVKDWDKMENSLAVQDAIQHSGSGSDED
ncbi:unnamed protein product [Spirodela intermedia]|uniref:Uncharacterized protein n=1 Tax=Spirodela intermedia TaxID=51605 RepID=A0A7I8IGR1_SPIIN|nr:unnamed protein product [Spirodela intermedia]CAA6657081.1 unnamed protein product [Spirodela intermedia]